MPLTWSSIELVAPPPVCVMTSRVDERSAQSWRCTATLFRELTQLAPLMMLVWIFIGSLAGGLTSAVQPFFMQQSWAAEIAGRSFHDVPCPVDVDPANMTSWCREGLTRAASFDGYSGTVGSLLSFLLLPWTGAFADRVGPKILLIASSVISLPPTICIWIAVWDAGNMTWIWAYYVSKSLCVTWFLPIILSTFATICSPENRAAAFSIVLATFELSLIIGPKIGAVIQGHFGPTSTYSWAMWLTIVQVIFACFFPKSMTVPGGNAAPTLTAELERGHSVDESSSYYILNRKEVDTAKAAHDRRCCKNICADFMRAMSILNRSKFFRVLAIMAFFQAAVGAGVETLFMYGLNAGFGFGMDDVSNFLTVVFASSAVTQLLLVQPLLRCLGTRGLLAFSLTCAVLNDFLNGLVLSLFQQGSFSFDTSRLIVFIIAGSLSNATFFIFPAIAALKANNVDDDEQGATQGALFSVKAIAGFIAPNIFTGLLSLYSTKVQVLFFFSASLSCVVLGLMWFLPPRDLSRVE